MFMIINELSSLTEFVVYVVGLTYEEVVPESR